MELIFKLIAIGFIGTVGVVLVRNVKPEISVFIAIAAGIIILIALSDKISEVMGLFKNLSDKSGLSASVFSAVIRIIGIGYLTEYSASVCEDNNCSSIGKKIQLAGKVIIFVMAIPVINGIISTIENIVP